MFFALCFLILSPPALASEGLPQFNPEFFPSQIFWMLLCFFVLYHRLSKWGLPRISEILEERQGRIQDDLAHAKAQQEHAAQAKENYEQALGEARSEAKKRLAAATAYITGCDTREQEKMRQDFEVQIQDHEADVTAAKKEALTGIETVVTELIAAIMVKIADVTPVAAKLKQTTSSVLKESGHV